MTDYKETPLFKTLKEMMREMMQELKHELKNEMNIMKEELMHEIKSPHNNKTRYEKRGDLGQLMINAREGRGW